MPGLVEEAQKEQFHAVVIGGGPAGAIAAATLARAGRSVLLLERDHFPRFHVGESLLPLSDPVLRSVGLWDALRAEGFQEKWGATFLEQQGELSFRADFSDVFGEQGKACHVLRSRFDEILLRHARDSGADVREGCRARSIEFDKDGANLIYEDEDGGPQGMRASFVIDASGRQGFLAQRMKLRQPDDKLRKVAVYGHFSGVPGQEGRAKGDIRIVSRDDLGWIWIIPLADGTTSVGAVFDREEHESGADPDAVLARYIASTPVAAAAMAGAEPTLPARYEADFSYSVSAYAGDRWLLTGDAGSFLDPVFSTGVHLAVHSGSEAAQAVHAGTPRAMRRFDKVQARRYRFFRRFVLGFYDPGFRDIFFHPGNARGMYRAIVGVLAGDDRPSLLARIRIALFLALTRLQKRVKLVERIHGNGSTNDGR